MGNIEFTEYLHKETQTVWIYPKEMQDNDPIIIEFQQSKNPALLGFSYERDYEQIQILDVDTI